jgi:WD40 repeat protein
MSSPAFGWADEWPPRNPRVGYALPALTEIRQISGWPKNYSPISLSPNGRLLLLVSSSRAEALIWDLKSGHIASRLDLNFYINGSHIEWSDDGQRILVIYAGGRAAVFDVVGNGKPLCSILRPADFSDAALSPDGRKLLMTGRGVPMRLFTVDDGVQRAEFWLDAAHQGMNAVAFASNEIAVATSYAMMTQDTAPVFLAATGRVTASMHTGYRVEPGKLRRLSAGAWFSCPVGIVSVSELEGTIAATEQPVITPRPIGVVGGFALSAFEYIPWERWPGRGSESGGTLKIDPLRGLVWPLAPDSEPGFALPFVMPSGESALIPGEPGSLREVGIAWKSRPRAWPAGRYNTHFAFSHKQDAVAVTDIDGLGLAWHPGTAQPIAAGVNGVLRSLSSSIRIVGDRMEGLVVVIREADAAGHLASNSLRAVDWQSGAVVRETPLPYLFYKPQLTVSPSGQFVLVSTESAGFPSPYGPMANGTTSTLQLYDANLARIGEGFPAHRQLGVTRAVFSPLETCVATLSGSYSDDGGAQQLQVLDLKSQRQLGPPIATERVSAMALSDAGVLITVSKRDGLRAYQISTGAMIAHRDTERPNTAVGVSPSGKLVATYGFDHEVRVWALPDLNCVGAFDGAYGYANQDAAPGQIAFWDDTTVVAVFSGDQSQLRFLPLADAFNTQRWIAAITDGAPSCLALSRDGRKLAVGEGSGVVSLYDLRSNRRIAAVPGHAGGVKSIEFAPDGSEVISVGADGVSRRWNLEKSHTPLGEMPAHSAVPELVIETKNFGRERLLLNENGIGAIAPDSSRPQREVVNFRNSRNGATAVVPLPDRGMLALLGWSDIRLFSVERGEYVWRYDVPSAPWAAVYDAANGELICAHDDHVIRRWRLPSSARTIQ